MENIFLFCYNKIKLYLCSVIKAPFAHYTFTNYTLTNQHPTTNANKSKMPNREIPTTFIGFPLVDMVPHH